jgi:hypothetical protein
MPHYRTTDKPGSTTSLTPKEMLLHAAHLKGPWANPVLP